MTLNKIELIGLGFFCLIVILGAWRAFRQRQKKNAPLTFRIRQGHADDWKKAAYYPKQHRSNSARNPD